MRFEAGKFYQQEGGRRIAIGAETVNTIVWGEAFFVEAYDNTGYEVSFLAIATMPDVGADWVEISRQEYMENFIYVPCEGCGAYIQQGQNYVKADEGFYHAGPPPNSPNCYKPMASGIPIEAVDILGPDGKVAG